MEDIIHTFWFGNPIGSYRSYWFDTSKDHEIRTQFAAIHAQLEQASWPMTHRSKLIYIIVLDQFTRNLYRNDPSRIQQNDEKAFALAMDMLHHREDFSYHLFERFFLLLPLRHQRTSSLHDFVLSRLDEYDMADHPDLIRFKMATLRSYTNLTDKIEFYHNPQLDPESRLDLDCRSYSAILDDRCQYRIDVGTTYVADDDRLYRHIRQFYLTHRIRRPCISLSGGVDSMVLAHITLKLWQQGHLDKMLAVHLEYRNRVEAVDETEYILQWCLTMGIPLYVRRITHITRATDREFFETESREIRFALYRYAEQMQRCDGVVLGHHRGDLVENVFMNLLQGRDLMDLAVMQPVERIQGIQIMRPAYQMEKSEIFDYADRYRIPYMKNSTPVWSQRAKLRDVVLPLLHREFGSIDVSGAMIRLARQSAEMATVMDGSVLGPILESIEYGPCGCKMRLSREQCRLPSAIWMRILVQMFHRMNAVMISHKNLDAFVEWLQHQHPFYKNRIQLSNQYHGIDTEVDHDDGYKSLYFISPRIQTLNTLIHPSTPTHSSPMTYDDILQGSYSYYVAAPSRSDLIPLTSFNKKDPTRKLFSHVHGLRHELPILHYPGNIDHDTPIWHIQFHLT